MYKFGTRSKSNLVGVKTSLVNVANRALEICYERGFCDFGISCGVRTEDEQREMFKNGNSKTMNSRHLTGDAIDVFAIVNGQVDWSWKHYEDIFKAFEQACLELNIDVEWGGNWESFKDGCHYQIPWGSYDEY